MQVAQRGTSETGITTPNYYTADRWRIDPQSCGTWTNTIETDAPDGFNHSLKVLCTTADTPLTASEVMTVHQRLEGVDLQHVAKGTSSAKELTASFWVKSNVTGTYIVECYDNDNVRQVSKSYTITSSDTWQKVTLTFPADTTGVLDNDTSLSMFFLMWLAAGPAFTSGTLNTSWNSSTLANRVVGQTNLASAVNNYWQVTGVQLELGDKATPFEYRSYGEELALCQRYFWRNIDPAGFGVNGNSNATRVLIPFPTTMRAIPSISGSGTYNFWNGVTTATTSTLRTNYSTTNAGQIDFTGGLAGSNGDPCSLYTDGGSQYIDFYSEL
jgi:hypothetical protein